LTIPTPVWQPEIRLRAAGAAPPTTAEVSPVISTCLFGSWSTRAVPAAFVPRKQPSTRLFVNAPVVSAIPTPQCATTRPLIVVLLAATERQAPLAAVPSISIRSTVSRPCPTGSVFAEAPDCV
jgi:hypothetical protein